MVLDATRLCAAHARALDPAELYRLEREASAKRRAPLIAAQRARIDRAMSALTPEPKAPRGRRAATPPIVVGKRLHG